MKFKLNYWFGQMASCLGFCHRCWNQLNPTRNSQLVCPNCKKRYTVSWESYMMVVIVLILLFIAGSAIRQYLF